MVVGGAYAMQDRLESTAKFEDVEALLDLHFGVREDSQPRSKHLRSPKGDSRVGFESGDRKMLNNVKLVNPVHEETDVDGGMESFD